MGWAAPDSDYTLEFEDLVTWHAQRCDKTTVATLMRIAWRTVGSIIGRVVEGTRQPIDVDNLTAISIDELSYRKGRR